MNKRIEKEIDKIYKEVFNKIFTKNEILKFSEGQRISIEEKIFKISNSDKYNRFAKLFSEKLAKQGLIKERGIWRKYFNAAKSMHVVGLPLKYSDYEKKVMNAAIINNFNMIKSIPSKIIEVVNHKYSDILINEVAEGKISRGSFFKELKSHGYKQAKVIARTETAKLQTVILESRASQLGSICYEWRSSNDKRTRPSHYAMNTVIVFWGKDIPKPKIDNMIGNAGEFPNCRCTPQPIFDIKKLTKPIYKVYDYNINKIISMRRIDLVESIKKGSLSI